MIFVALYVDDMMIYTNSTNWLNTLKASLMKVFEMKDLGEAENCIGLYIRDKENCHIYLDQQKYVNEILSKFGMADCKPVSTPIDPNQKLSSDMSPKTSHEIKKVVNVPYQEAVGSLIYLSQCTRPDIVFAVSCVSRYNKNSGQAHWNSVKCIFRYLKHTAHTKLK